MTTTPDSQPSADHTPPPPPLHSQRADRRSYLDSLRHNRMGVLTAALAVAFVLGLLLSVLVPNDPGALALILLSALMAAAVGFTVRYLSEARGLLTQIVAFIATAIGVHITAVTGAASGATEAGAEGLTFNDALLIALTTPPVSTGGFIAGLAAAIFVGWGAKPVGRIDLE